MFETPALAHTKTPTDTKKEIVSLIFNSLILKIRINHFGVLPEALGTVLQFLEVLL